MRDSPGRAESIDRFSGLLWNAVVMADPEYGDPAVAAVAREMGIEPDYERLGRYVTRRRHEMVETSLADLIRTSGVSDKTWRNASEGKPVVQPSKLAAMSRALGWTADSLQAILFGSEPTIDSGDAIDAAVFTELAKLRDQIELVAQEVVRLGGRPVLEPPDSEPE